jgi:hypothetical protein
MVLRQQHKCNDSKQAKRCQFKPYLVAHIPWVMHRRIHGHTINDSEGVFDERQGGAEIGTLAIAGFSGLGMSIFLIDS